MTPAAEAMGVPGRPASRVPWRTVAQAAIVVTLVRPASWLFGLAGFLAGGGLLAVAWPILVLPTPTGVQNALGVPAMTLVFGTVSLALALLFLGGFALFAATLLAGTWVGAWAERQSIAVALDAAVDEAIVPAPGPSLADAPGTWRVFGVRLLSLVPLLVALAASWGPVYDATYRQLTVPDELVTPLPLRVIADVPAIVALNLLVWVLADAAAAVGVRRLVLERRGVLGAWLGGWVGLVRSPLRVLGTQVVGIVVMVLLVAPAMLAAAAGWSRVRQALIEGRDPLTALAVVATWVGMWLGGLVLAGVGSAFRNAAWTFLALPRRHRGELGRV